MKVRYLIKYTKDSSIKFISHLDLMRTIQRVIRRGRLPVEYSKGFNPHMSISIAQPLSVGMYSSGEYMDIILTETLNESYIKDVFNENSPEGIRCLNVVMVPHKENEKKIPQSMAVIDAARYTINIRYENTDNLKDDLAALSKLREWNIIKKSKSGEKNINIKPMVRELKYKISQDCIKMNTVISTGSKENLSAELLAKFIMDNTKMSLKDRFVDIQRVDMYAACKGKHLTIDEYFKQSEVY